MQDSVSRTSAASRTEKLLTSRHGFGLPATPCQRAICRVLDGVELGELEQDPDVIKMLGGVIIDTTRVPEQLVLVAGIRTGKSMIAACYALVSARYCDMSGIGIAEEPPKVPVTSIHKRNAKAILGHCVGLLSLPSLVGWNYDGRPPGHKSEKVTVKHRWTGRPITIEIVANSAAADNLKSFWHAAAIVDETFSIPGKEEAVVNLDDVRKSLIGRILPGGRILYEGSPWAAEGPAYDMLEASYGISHDEVACMWTNGPAMNPVHWTSEKMAEMAISKDPRVREALVMGGQAKFLSDVSGVIPDEAILESMRPRTGCQVLPPVDQYLYWAVIDPATRRNAWTLMIGHREGKRLVVDRVHEWIPDAGKRLRPAEVLVEVGEIAESYHVYTVYCDQWSSDSNTDLAEISGFELIKAQLTPNRRQKALIRIVAGFNANNRFELPRDKWLKKDLKAIDRSVRQGPPTYVLRETPDGRHADYVSSLMLLDTLAFESELTMEERFPSDLVRRERSLRPGLDQALRLGVNRPVSEALLRRIGL